MLCLLTVFVDVAFAGDTTIKGTTSDNTAAALEATNSTDVSLLFVRNDGNVGVGDTSPLARLTVGAADEFRVSSTGDLIRIKDVPYVWPAANAAGVLTNDASGNLSWTAGGGSGNTLDQAYDQGGAGAGRTITVDSGAVQLTGSNAAAVTLQVTTSAAGGAMTVENTSTGESFRVNDGAGDTTPFLVDLNGNVSTGGTLSTAGAITSGTASATTGALTLQNSTNANTLTIQSGVTSASHTLTLPTAQGGANTFLKNGGTGTLSWDVPSSTKAYALKTGAYTITTSDDVIAADASSGAFAVTLPTAVGLTGRIFTVKRINSGANNVTVDTTGGETIDGDTTQVLVLQHTSIDVVSDGADWFIL